MGSKGIKLAALICISIAARALPTYSQDRDIDVSKAHLPNPFISGVEIFGGPSLLSIRGNEQYKQYGEIKIGYSFGVGLIHKISKSWTVNTQIGFESKGYKQSANALFPPDSYNNPPTYILPPVLTELKGNLTNSYLTIGLLPLFFVGNGSKIYLSVGPYYAKLIKSQVTRTDIQNEQVKLKVTLDQKDTFKSYDFGISYSIGLIVKEYEKVKILLRVNYNYGIPNVKEIQSGIEPQKNNSLSVTLSFQAIPR